MLVTPALKRANEKVISAHLEMIAVDMKLGNIPPEEVNMRTYTDEDISCGTTHCIGGWLGLRLGQKGVTNPLYDGPNVHVSDAFEERLNNLMYMALSKTGDTYTGDWAKVSVSKVIKAIHNFNNGAKYPWQGVVSNDE